MNITIKELCEKFWLIEENLNLFKYKIKEVYFWELIRFNIFISLSKQLCGYGQAHTSKNTFMDKLENVFGIIKNSFIRNPLFKNYKVDFIIFDHPRKVKVNGSYIDIYTHYFINSMKTKKYLVIESPYLWEHKSDTISKFRKYRDHEILTTYLKRKLMPLKFDNKDLLLIDNIQSEFNRHFNNTKINFHFIIKQAIEGFIHKKNYYKKLFIKRRPKEIYIVISYTNYPIIAAAKELQIKVIEFQHGVINDYHIAYNFSSSGVKLKYFPDEIWTFGEYWGKTKHFPKQTQIVVKGFPYLNNQIEKFKNVHKKNNQILFLSQGTIGKELSSYAKKLAEVMPDYNIVYKLHPGEYDRWKKEYPELYIANNYSNFTVVDNNNKNLYQYLAESKYQIGVYSTSIFEGLTMGCITILIDLPGIDYMKDLIEKEFVSVADNINELKYQIKNFKPKKFPKDYFFK